MVVRKIISVLMAILILVPPTQVWSQGSGTETSQGLGGVGTPQGPSPAAPVGSSPDLKSQAELYLQQIPSPLSPTQQKSGPVQLLPSNLPSLLIQPQLQPQLQQQQLQQLKQQQYQQLQQLQQKQLEEVKQLQQQQLQPQQPDEITPQKGVHAVPRELTSIEKLSLAQGIPLTLFGYSLFNQPPSSFLPVTAIPVGPDYIIGPGDTIRITIWGNVQGEYNPTVDRNGQIAIPTVGIVQVSGLTFKQLQEVLLREFSRLISNFQMNVTLDNLRTIRIYVVGQAQSPGSYSVSSLSTLINGLLASNGPSTSGSLRDIQVRRQGRTIVHFDLYNFLIKGDKTKDIRLMSEDVIFIPYAGKRAGIGGPVKTPGIYELKGERTLSELIHLAGGLDPTTFKSRVQVLRVKDRKEMVLTEDDLEKFLSGRYPDIILSDGDIFKVFSVPSVNIRTVRITGQVQNPGEFGYRDNMRVKDLITFAGGFLLQTNLEEAELTRVTVTPNGPETSRIYINLRRAMADMSRDNILLKPNDLLAVRSVPDWHLYQMVTIDGEVKFPGRFSIKKGETLSGVLARAGGLTDGAYKKGAIFTREAVKKVQAEHLKQAVDKIEAEMIATSSQQTQTSLDKEDVERQRVILAQQQRFLAKMRTAVPLGRVVIHVDDAERLRGTPNDLQMEEGDVVMVPKIQQTVNVLGSVVSPTAVVYDPYLTVKDYLAKVGGATKHADVKSLYVIKANGSALSGGGNILFGGRITSMRLDPGDTIIVPEDLERVAWLKGVKDVATILGQFALMAGVVFAAIK